MRLVECVNQGDEALGLVEVAARQGRNIVDHQNLACIRNGQKIGRAKRFGAQIKEIRAPHSAAEVWDGYGAPIHGQVQRIGIASGEICPDRIHLRARISAKRREIGRAARQPVLTVIRGRSQFSHHHLLFQQFDERHKELSVQPVFVEVIGDAVGRGHHNHPGSKERFEQSPYDHRIRDVRNLHFIKSQQADRGRNISCNRGYGVVNAALTGDVHGGVDFLHESMEMDPAGGDRDVADKEIHQHGLAPTNATPKVQTGNGIGGFAKKTAFDRFGQGAAYPLKLRQCRQLSVVCRQRARFDQRLIFRD
mmetsp:Transcript_29693/g.58892  ORF Transcript_29693/g.58892 Transcript_29693/m.58892 type:complete len:307 (-) Transcript_29693:30-950(-)